MTWWRSRNRSELWRASAREALEVAQALTHLGQRMRASPLGHKLANPTVVTLIGLARALEVTLGELFEHHAER